MTLLFGGNAECGDRLDWAADNSRRRRAFWAAFGLVYMVPVAGGVTEYHGVKLVIGWIALAAFASLYIATALSRASWHTEISRWTWALFSAFAVLCVTLPFALGPNWLGAAIYLSMICAMVLPMRLVPWGVVASAAMGLLQCWANGMDGSGTLTISVVALSLGMFMWAFRHARTLVQELQAARGEVARLAAVEERLRIARDLHDLLGHSLSLIVLKSELARRVGQKQPEKMVGEVNDIESVARQALADVRAAISGYRQRDLAEEILSARAVLTAAGIQAVVRRPDEPLPDVVDGLFGWAVREAVTNAVRHSRAKRCTITITRDGEGASLEVVDDGTGAADAAEADGSGVGGSGVGGSGGGFRPGNGLTGLSERIAEAGGSFAAAPVEGGGFRLSVHVPVARTVSPAQTPA
ncbi:sensor histidine kinase [Actinomadura barringtoniae]|uniref:Sensor histidine kinase n=1 Tax=Actinomadura barringtoniae TaxID=1427535 RepID=A0A939PQI5_9ACTN|nr:sensor histidine kinase [Actinomadura barringtoniae]MBO2452881.1 sensor histidine kinase [Actinomadura barringtoniae]